MAERVKVVLVCPYCGAEADLVDSAKIYKKSFGMIYLCGNYPMCDAYVGTHKATGLPLGSMANERLRDLRKKAHDAFDKIWRDGDMYRKDAYKLMRKWLGIQRDQAHIAMLTEGQCLKLIEMAGNYKPVEKIENKPFRDYFKNRQQIQDRRTKHVSNS